MTTYVHLHTHSYYSLLDGTMSLEELVQQARKQRFRHLALTDHNALYGAVQFYRLAKAAGIHAIVGAEISLTDNTNLILLVKNETGYRNLCQLLSLGHLQGGHLMFRLELKDFTRFNAGVIALSGGEKGKLWQLARLRRIDEAKAYCRRMKAVFGEDFFIEIQQFDTRDILTNIRLRDLAIQHGLSLVATNNVHLLTGDDWELRRTLHAIDQNALADQITTAGSPQQYLKSVPEMQQLFSKFPEALENSEKIARRCTFEFSLGKPIFPRLDLPGGETAFSYLWKKSFDGARRRYQPLTEKLIQRLSYELNTIHRLGFADYFLIVKDIVDFCSRNGIPCVGRGSAGDSMVSYVLGITQADPLRYDLYFERFLNPERADSPDIDLDICQKNRDQVLEYVYKKYGKDHTAMICTFNTFQLRSSIRNVARTFGFPEDEIAMLTKYLPHYGIDKLSQALEHLPECHDLQQNSTILKHVLQMAARIANFPRHASIHPGGIVIAPENITYFTPLQVAAKGLIVAHYDMYSIEPLGLVKMDLLGVRSLTIIAECLTSVRQCYHQNISDETVPGAPYSQPVRGVANKYPELPFPPPEEGMITLQHPPNPSMEIYRYHILKKTILRQAAETYLSPRKFPFLDTGEKYLSPLDLRMIPENDPNVTALLRSGQSLSCFQLESPVMRALLQKMQVEGVDDVVTAVALIRPGAASSGMKDIYIQRRAGLLEVKYPHPILEPFLKDTYGHIVYQEQVMQIASSVAGFSLAQADVLRRAMTKSRNRKTLLSMHSSFIEGAGKKGISPAVAGAIWSYLSNFVGYGFNKAHSATYGVIAYQTAFLKYHFPVHYMTAVLNNRGGFYSRAAYVEECRRMGIVLQPPDVNLSQFAFTCAGNAIRVGLDMIYEISGKTRASIMRERKSGFFRDYYDFVQRVRPREGEMRNLIKSGALRSLDENEPRMLLQNQLFFKNKFNRNLTESRLCTVRLEPYNRHHRILNELEILDFAVSDHPLSLFSDKIPWDMITPSFELENRKGKQVRFVGWLVTSRRVKTRNRDYMRFLTLEDRYGLCEVVMFPGVYGSYGHLIRNYGPYIITGTVQSRLPGEANLLAEKLEVVELGKHELEQKLQRHFPGEEELFREEAAG